MYVRLTAECLEGHARHNEEAGDFQLLGAAAFGIIGKICRSHHCTI
jgi:hypothetical protein